MTFVPISAATMQGVKELPGLVYNRLKDIPPVPVFCSRVQEARNPRPTTVRLRSSAWKPMCGAWKLRGWSTFWPAATWTTTSLQYFQRQLGESGILDALVAKGVEENDTILIGDYQFDYIF